jgi:ABC-type antimicrobial peptide transport system permease subunit
VITASVASTLWPAEPPIGRHFQLGSGNPIGLPSLSTELEVVGVVKDFAYGSMRFDPHYVVLSAWPSDESNSATLPLIIRTADPAAFIEPLRRKLAELVPNAPHIRVKTGRDLLAADLGRERFGAFFFSGFGLVTLVLGASSVFGMIAYLAESRRREFGIRAALGATTSRLARTAIAAGMIPVAAGSAAGLTGALVLGKAAESFLLGVTWFDPVTYVAACAAIAGCAGCAGLVAAWRIKRIAPSEALRAE